MRRTLIIAGTIVALVVAWLVGGRQLVLLVDQFATEGEAKPTMGPFVVFGGSLNVGKLPLDLAAPDYSRDAVRIDVDDAGRVSLHADGKTFPLGARIDAAETIGPYEVAFAPDQGDVVTLRFSHSLFGWPSPLELNFITGSSPSWKRHTYYTVSWRKRDGAQLEMTWRYEQWFYDDWASPMMTHEGVTGLISTRTSKD